MTRIITATATRGGTRPYNCDAAAVYQLANGVTGAAVVDGVGNCAELAAFAPVLAQVAARVAAGRRSPLAGVLSAGELVAHEPGNGLEHMAVAVVAYANPTDTGPTARWEADPEDMAALDIIGDDGPAPVTVVDWVGDCEAWGWNGKRLRRWTTPHTIGEQLRQNGAPLEIAADHDNWIRTHLGRASVATVRQVEIPDPLVIMLSDGVRDHMPTPHRLVELIAGTLPDPSYVEGNPAAILSALAVAIVGAMMAEVGDGGEADDYRDDGTALLLWRYNDA